MSDSWPALKEGMIQAMALTGVERQQYLRGFRQDLMLELEELMAFHQKAEQSNFLRQPLSPELIDADQTCASTAVFGTHSDTSYPIARPSPSVPDRIDRFEVLRILGEGSFGAVYLCHDPSIEREVAIKVPLNWEMWGPSGQESFRREASNAAKLHHPNVVSIYDVREDASGVPYIVMEYVAGGTLRDRLRDGPLGIDETKRIVTSVANAVATAHKTGLFHRDLKPGNILLDADGTPKIADFGLAISEEALLKRRGEVAGTPAYMSPEQASGNMNQFDGRTDIWAIGVILYECLSGRRPFAGTDRDEILAQIQERQVRPLRQINDHIPPILEDLCNRCLSKQPADRPSTASDICGALSKPGNRGKRLAIVSSLVVIVSSLVAAAAIAFVSTRDPDQESPAGPGDDVVKRERSDDSYPHTDVHGRTYDLLDGGYTVSYVSPDEPASTAFFAHPTSTAHLSSNEFSLMLVGRTDTPRFTVRVTISKVRKVGQGGVVLGFTRQKLADGSEDVAFDAILVTCLGGKEAVVQRDVIRGKINKEKIFVSLERRGLAAQRVEFSNVREHPLEIQVTKDELKSVRFDGVPLRKLTEPSAMPREFPQVDRLHLCGEFGLVNSMGATAFRSFLFTPHKY